MFRTGYIKTDPPRYYDELRRRTTRPDVKLSGLLQTFRYTQPFLSLKPKETEPLISVSPSKPPVCLEDTLTQKELRCFRLTSDATSCIHLIPQSEPLPDLISLEERSVRLQSAYPHIDLGRWDDLWRLLCTFRLPDHVLVVAGKPLTNTNGSQCVAMSLHRFIIFYPYEQGCFQIPSEIVQNNTVWWLARPRS